MSFNNEAFVALLGKLEWPVPPDVFYALAAKIILPTADLAIIEKRKGRAEVLLTKRPPSDPFFAGLWHLPGAIIMPGETALSTIEKRVLKPDVGISLPREPQFVLSRDILMGPAGEDTSPRGQEAYRLFEYVLRAEDPNMPVDGAESMLCPLDEMPSAFVRHQMPSIRGLRAIHSA